MSELADALSRMLWRYEKAKSFTESQSGKDQIDADSKVILESYIGYQTIALEIFYMSVSGDFDDPDFERMDVDLIILWANFKKWEKHGLEGFDALDAAITEGCPFQYFEQLSYYQKSKLCL
jgi:hypothetical protein